VRAEAVEQERGGGSLRDEGPNEVHGLSDESGSDQDDVKEVDVAVDHTAELRAGNLADRAEEH
jgi:hypothetical protein